MTEDAGVIIRRMTEADLPRVKGIDNLLTGEERASSWPVEAEKLWAVYRPLLSFVAECDGKVVGFILGDIRGVDYGTSASSMSGWIDMVGVDLNYQRHGIGRKLVEAFYQECQRNQVRARVLIREDDQRLKKLWGAAGFKRGKLIDFER
jgi:ribosomal protein S18 acetylase RimI-like enzyme